MYFIHTSVVPTSAHRQVLYCPILQNRWWCPGSPNDPPDVFQPRPSAVSSHQAAATINTCSRSRAAIVLAPQPGNKQFVKLYHTIIPSIPSPQITSSGLRKRLDWLHCDLLFVNSARVPSPCCSTIHDGYPMKSIKTFHCAIHINISIHIYFNVRPPREPEIA